MPVFQQCFLAFFRMPAEFVRHLLWLQAIKSVHVPLAGDCKYMAFFRHHLSTGHERKTDFRNTNNPALP